GVEALDLAGDAGGEGRRVEMGDRTDARTAADDAVPARGQVVAERRQDADAGDGDAALGHVRLSPHRFLGASRAVGRRKTHEAAMRPRGLFSLRPRGPDVTCRRATPGRRPGAAPAGVTP